MKKLLALVLSLVFILSLTTCVSLAEEEPVTLKMLQRLPASYVVEGNPVIEAWGEMLGVKIEIEAPPISSYNDRRNIILASPELPDIIYVGDTGSSYAKWAADGLFLDLTDYLNEEDMPNAYRVLTDLELNSVKVASLDNHIFSLPRVQTKPMDTILYRKDWLDKLNLEVPTTPSEFAAVMEAFTTLDPDGNGIDDTYGFTINLPMGAAHRSITSAFDMRPSEVPDAEGNYQVMEAQEGYMDYLDWLREMYLGGYIEPEFYLITNYEDRDQFHAGKVGAVYANMVVEHYITEMSETAWVDKNFELVAGGPLCKEGEDVANVYYNPQIWGNYAISATTEHLDEAIAFLDACYTDAVNELLMFGVEGVTYTTFNHEGHYSTKTEEQLANWQKYCATYATINYQCEDKGLLIANGNTEEEVALFNAANDAIAAMTNRVTFLSGGSLPGVAAENTKIVDMGITDKFGELRTKYICGQIERDEMVDFLTNEYAPAYEALEAIYAEYDMNK